MTKPEESESVQTDGLAEGDRVEFQIQAPQRGRQGRQAIDVKIRIFCCWLHHSRAQQEVRDLSSWRQVQTLMCNPCYPVHVRQILTPTVDPLLCGNEEFLHVARMTKPDETESVQTYGLAEGDRVEVEIEEPQRGRKGRQAINVKIGIFGFWLHQFRAQREVREMS